MDLWTFISLVLALLNYVYAIEFKKFPTPTSKEDIDYWKKLGFRDIQDALQRYADMRGESIPQAVSKTKFPKNVILFIGDGMSIATVTGARIHKGQKLFKQSGEEQFLSWERFPASALMKTYVVNKQTGDSAATAMAMFTGVKTTYRTLGYDHKVVRKRPSTHKSAEKLFGVLSWAQEAGLKTGIVTTTRLTHATPAALYAHAANRDWECDTFVNREKVHSAEPIPSPDEFPDIARQMVESAPANNTDVILGGGLLSFKAVANSSYVGNKWVCQRSDGRDLIKEWKAKKAAQGGGQFVSDLQGLKAAKANKPLLGVFSETHLPYEYQRPSSVPSLSDMTETAIELLHRDDPGFFLMVEGGRIDHAHHKAQGKIALDETLALDQAVQKALDTLEKLNIREETLVIVTADHGHTMTLPGYPARGADINGFLGKNEIDGKLETPMVYANGPGGKSTHLVKDGQCSRVDLGARNIKDMKYVFPAPFPRYEESHGSEDVGLWASGPLNFLFHRTHEQSYIGHVLAFSLCIGHYKDNQWCRQGQTSRLSGRSDNVVVPVVSALSIIGIVILLVVIWKKTRKGPLTFGRSRRSQDPETMT